MNTAPAWKLWANPVLRRYARSRLRPSALGVGIILSLLLAGFVFFVTRTIALHPGRMAVVDAERVPLLPLLVIQAIILFFLGTGQVAGGMTAEADEGVIDYQRLTPLTPMTKVLGYLFGLPLREYVMFACTLPFTAWGLWRGEVPFHAWGSMYLVLFTSTLLYHLTGLVAGTVVKNRRWAFLVSIGIVFLLYTVMPQAARFGLTTFKYFTLSPVFAEQMRYFVPHTSGELIRAFRQLTPEVGFFGLHFSETVFSLFSQAGLILTFVVMLWRRWRKAESHLLGKVWAVGLMVWTQVMLLGNALPLIPTGLVFPSRGFQGRVMGGRGWEPSVSEGMAMIGLYGLVALMLVLVLTSIITPTQDGQVRGWRRARKLGLARPPWFSDAATGFWFVLALAAVATAGWFLFARALVGSSWYAGHALPPHALWAFALVIFTASLTFHALSEVWGARPVFLSIVFVGVAPIMVGATLAAASDQLSDRLLSAGLWIIGISPFAAPVFASQVVMPTVELPVAAARAVPAAFWFWQALAALSTAALVHRLVRHLRAGRDRA
jgi:hypothetical protein